MGIDTDFSDVRRDFFDIFIEVVNANKGISPRDLIFVLLDQVLQLTHLLMEKDGNVINVKSGRL